MRVVLGILFGCAAALQSLLLWRHVQQGQSWHQDAFCAALCLITGGAYLAQGFKRRLG